MSTRPWAAVSAAFFLACTAAAARAQTADEVITKHIAAIGGRDALTRITSRRATGTITQTVTITLAKIEHNVPLDDALFTGK
jgi:hypothetical protein